MGDTVNTATEEEEKVLILGKADLGNLLSMKECVSLLKHVLCPQQVVMPLRPIMRIPQVSALMGLMPAYMEVLTPPADGSDSSSGTSKAMLGVKCVNIFNSNRHTKYDTHMGVVLLFEATTGRTLAILDAAEVTAIRTAATSAVATDVLSSKDIKEHTLCILGSGVQAKKHVEAMLAVRGATIKRVKVWSRSLEAAQEFAVQQSNATGLEVLATHTVEEAVRGSTIICTTTASPTPILDYTWIAPGAHINAVGACTPVSRELHSNVISNSDVYVDNDYFALNEAGDIIIPLKEGLVDASVIKGDFKDILHHDFARSGDSDRVTVFKSVGMAIEDVGVAQFLYDKCLKSGAGVWVDF